MKLGTEDKRELAVYAALWAILFAAPLLSAYVQTAQTGVAFRWGDVTGIWRQYALFFVVFLIHNFLLAPLLIYRQRRGLYFTGIAVLLACFVAVQCAHQPRPGDRPMPRDIGEMGMHGEPRPDFEPRQGDFEPREDNFQGDFERDAPPPKPLGEQDGPGRHGRLIGEHDMVATAMLVLMLGMNIGVKLYFRQRTDRQRMTALERQNLEQQLEYLKYQINPHFLMNTLNNIHALVDIDPEQAKETIVELSKIMRFVLYEGSKQTVPLRQELIFLENYIQLMRMRVAEQVDISVDIPPVAADREIPPLMLITFVENAFKHGVSYQQHSFIDISISIEDNHLHFRCQNSRVPQGEDRHGGVGLQNVRRRLDLIYGHDYTLDISDQKDTYTVNLTLPL